MGWVGRIRLWRGVGVVVVVVGGMSDATMVIRAIMVVL
jgi:hypothetical protein